MLLLICAIFLILKKYEKNEENWNFGHANGEVRATPIRKSLKKDLFISMISNNMQKLLPPPRP